MEKLKRRNNKTKYSLGSLLLLLAFAFYVGCNPDKKEPIQEQLPVNETIEVPEVNKQQPSLSGFQGKVTAIKDGDTFVVLCDGKTKKIRLFGIDCPENSQPFGKAAKKFASDLCYGKTVTVIPQQKKDQYGRVLGVVMTSDGLNVNEELIRVGFAWNYKYSKNTLFVELEKEARLHKRGLWADENPINPWQWRKQNNTSRR